MILYIVLVLIIILVIFFTYIKIKYKFWSIQPVFHFYNILYLIKEIGIINIDLPCYNKYLNIININTKDINELDNTESQLILNYMKNNYNDIYLDDIYIQYKPNNNILNYLKNCNHSSYISIYKKEHLLTNNNNIIDIVKHYKYDGIITSKILYIKFNNIKSKFNNTILPLYYINNIVVNKKSNLVITQQLIQTHCYHLRKYNKKVKCCLLKKEGNLKPIVPFIKYKTYLIDIINLINTPDAYNASYYVSKNYYKIIIITKQTFHLLKDFIQINKNNFECLIMTDYSNLINSIENNIYIIYCLICNDEIKSIYFYKNLYLQYKNNNCIELFSSIKSNTISDLDFNYGFILSLFFLNKNLKNKYLFIENLSNNTIIIDFLKKINIFILLEKNVGYCLYNFIKHPLDSCKCLIIP